MARTSPSLFGQNQRDQDPADPRPPASFVVTLAFAIEFAWVALALSTELPGTITAVGVVAIALVSSWWLPVSASLALAVISFLVVDGFADNQMGQLHWDANPDTVYALALLVGCVLVAEVRSEIVEERRRRGSPHP